MSNEVILTVIQYLHRGFPERLGFSSRPYFGDATGLKGGCWFPVLDPNMSVSLNVSTEHDGGTPTDLFGDIRIFEFGDGIVEYWIDRLIRGIVAGQPFMTRRGWDNQEFDQMEIWAATEGDSRYFEDRVLTLTQRSRFSGLSKTVNQAVFIDVANQGLIGRTVPNILGSCTQVGPLEIDPSQLGLYIAENVSFNPDIHVAREGGAVIDPDFITTFGPFIALEKNPLLPVTFDVEGRNRVSIDAAVAGEVIYPMSTTDSVNPDDFTMDETGATISYLAGDILEVTVDVGAGTTTTGFVPLTATERVYNSEYAPWTITQGSGATSASGSSTLNSVSTPPHQTAEIQFQVAADSPALPTAGRWRISSIAFELDSDGLGSEDIYVYNGESGFVLSDSTTADGTAVAVTETFDSPYTDAANLANFELIFRWQASDLSASSVAIRDVSFDLEPEDVAEAAIYSNTGILTVGEAALIRLNVTGIVGRGYIRIGSAESVSGEITQHAVVTSSGVTSRSIFPTGTYLVIQFVPTGSGSTTFSLGWVSAGRATTINSKTALLISWLLQRAIDLRPSDNAAQKKNIAFNSLSKLGADTDEPELGWYVAGGETVQEMIDLIVRDSLCGVWIRDYDGTLRFALWRWLPNATKSATPILIEEHKIARTSLRTYVPTTVTRRVVGEKNVVPLQRDQAAGITSTFSQEERALLFEEFRHWKSGKALTVNGTEGAFSRWPQGEGE